MALVNPHSSIRELQTYFVFGPDSAIETVVRSKKTYDSPDKFLGGSPYEKVFQDQDQGPPAGEGDEEVAGG